ncbi:hypothetical protein BGX34_011511 [Mortierella sp. NVP85]|nr:hypothetical protein BGX34_011511 [Mortierella sp. NVP85]
MTNPGRGRSREFDWTILYRCRRERPAKQLKIRRASVGTGCPASIRFQKLVGQDRVIVKYHRHLNYDTSAESQALIPMGANDRNWIKFMVSRGLDWKGIKNELRPDEETIQSPEAHSPKLIVNLIACVDSTRGIARSLRPEKAERNRKNKNLDTSAYLFTILVKDRVLQKGIPVSHMVCSSES